MKKFALLLFIFTFSGVSAFSQGVVNEILKRMDAHQRRLSSLIVDMNITKHSVQANETYTKQGRVRFLPGKTGYTVRIDSTTPVTESFSVVNDEYMLYQSNPNPVYLPNTAAAYTGKLTDSQKKMLWIFLILRNSPRDSIKRDFTVGYKGEEKLNNKTVVWRLELKPKNVDLFKKIDLWIDGNGMPLQSLLTETGGDRTTVTLENLRKNEQLFSRDLQIKLPKDVKIIRD